jgi:hypothetical protein
MGRKNNRMQIAPDKSFIKFMDSINKRNNGQGNSLNKNKQDYSIEEKTSERLKYALKQFDKERIHYEVLNESKGAVKVYHQSNGNEYIFFALTGTLKNIDNLKGLMNVIEFLYT